MNSFEVGSCRESGKSTIPTRRSLLLCSPFFFSAETLENTSFVLILVPFGHWHKLLVIVACVDNAAARAQISQCLNQNSCDHAPGIFWLDCGNHASSSSGQVLLGTSNDFSVRSAFDNLDNPNFCINLPSPAVQHPELLVPLPSQLTSTHLSCAEIQTQNRQSLFVNQQVAAIASEYLLALTLTGGLRRFATYFDNSSGTMRSCYNQYRCFQEFA